jgi:uncharacterized protein
MKGKFYMNWVNDVWQSLNREQLGTFVRRVPSVLFTTVSGAHLYGFASADSDVDLRGVFLLPVKDLVGLTEPRETLASSEMVSGIELDFVLHDLRKFARMMTRHNGYVLEQLYSPLVVAGSQEFEELRVIGHGCLTRGLYKHYKGFAAGRRKLLNEPGATVKHLLYAYRVYMTGIRVLRGGGIETNIEVLNEDYSFSQVDEVIARKRTGTEKQALESDELSVHGQELDRLENMLQSAFDGSRLPDEAANIQELNDFVVRVRLQPGLNPPETESTKSRITVTG